MEEAEDENHEEEQEEEWPSGCPRKVQLHRSDFRNQGSDLRRRPPRRSSPRPQKTEGPMETNMKRFKSFPYHVQFCCLLKVSSKRLSRRRPTCDDTRWLWQSVCKRKRKGLSQDDVIVSTKYYLILFFSCHSFMLLYNSQNVEELRFKMSSWAFVPQTTTSYLTIRILLYIMLKTK